MSASLPGSRELPASQYDLSTYWGRVKQAAEISDPRSVILTAISCENLLARVGVVGIPPAPVILPSSQCPNPLTCALAG